MAAFLDLKNTKRDKDIKKVDIWHKKHMKIIIMTIQIYLYIHLITKF